MAGVSKFKLKIGAWNKIVKQVVDTQLEPAAVEIAAACNSGLDEDGYMASVEGPRKDRLHRAAYRATVITATGEAMRDNARNDTLINNMGVRLTPTRNMEF